MRLHLQTWFRYEQDGCFSSQPSPNYRIFASRSAGWFRPTGLYWYLPQSRDSSAIPGQKRLALCRKDLTTKQPKIVLFYT
jgi:hypothetical protein